MSGRDLAPARQRWLDVQRIVFFNDAVFAIAMTVLVFGFRVPESLSGPDDPRLTQVLRDHADDFLGYLLTFVVLGYYWVAHHRLFDHVRRADHLLLYVNLAFLCFVALLPYPAELLQHYGDTHSAVLFWAGTVALAGIAFTGLVLHAARNHRLIDPGGESYVRHLLLRSATVPAVMVASIAVAFVSITAAKLAWLAIPVIFVIYRRRYGSIRGDAY